MVNHFIFIASAYSLGCRIVLHYCDENAAQNDFKYIIEKCGKDAPVSTHFMQTDSLDWESVVAKDKFFKDVKVILSVDDFISLINKDQTLNGLDIAKYVLSKISCTHLKLQKLVYFCYADYLCNTGEKLFFDRIYAYRLGPVVDSVYKKYRKSVLAREDNKITYNEFDRKMSITSRILASKKGLEKLDSINKTLEKYGKYMPNELVDLTHKDNTPWFMSGKGEKRDVEISDTLILKYHKNEI